MISGRVVGDALVPPSTMTLEVVETSGLAVLVEEVEEGVEVGREVANGQVVGV